MFWASQLGVHPLVKIAAPITIIAMTALQSRCIICSFIVSVDKREAKPNVVGASWFKGNSTVNG